MSKLQSLQADLEELRRFHDAAERQRVKDILSIDIKKIETEITNLKSEEMEVDNGVSVNVSKKPRKTYTVKITSYGWDQSDSVVKIFITLNKLETVASENIVCVFTESSLDVLVKELDNKNHSLVIKDLKGLIKPNESRWRVKNDTLTLILAKANTGNWSYLTKTEEQTKKIKTPKPPTPDESDPSAGLMNMMKQLYESGDDEMKRTIAKAWTESRDKQNMM